MTGPWDAPPENPRTYPVRPPSLVEHAVAAAAAQHDELVVSMESTGQIGALVIADLERLGVGRGACTIATWAEGPVTVLPYADVLEVFELPRSIDDAPRATRVRWDVVARVCGPTCWSPVPDLDPPRLITRRWPEEAQLEILRGLALPDQP